MRDGILQPETTPFDYQCKNKRSLIRTKHVVIYSGPLRIPIFEICSRNVVCRTTTNTTYNIQCTYILVMNTILKHENSPQRENPLFATQKLADQPSVVSLGAVTSIICTYNTSSGMVLVVDTNLVDCALCLLFQLLLSPKRLSQWQLSTYLIGRLK